MPNIYRIYYVVYKKQRNYHIRNTYIRQYALDINNYDDVVIEGRTLIYSRKTGQHTKNAATFINL
jgi:hypothetical protein